MALIEDRNILLPAMLTVLSLPVVIYL